MDDGEDRTQPDRDKLLKHQAERLARMMGIDATALVGKGARNGCQVTRDGVVISVDSSRRDTLVARSGEGVEGALPPDDADMMMLLQLIAHALVFKDTSYFPYVSKRSGEGEPGMRFETVVDDMVADARMMRYPFFKRRYRAFITRSIPHDLTDLAMSHQLLVAVRLLSIEPHLAPSVSTPVSGFLHSAEGRDLVEQVSRIAFDEGATYRETHESAWDLLSPSYRYFRALDGASDRGIDLLDLLSRALPHLDLGGSMPGRSPLTLLGSASRVRQIILDLLNDLEDADEPAAGDDGSGQTAMAGREVWLDEGSTVFTSLLEKGLAATDWLDITGYSQVRYQLVVDEWHETIEQVADVFGQIATRSDTRRVSRYRSRFAEHGRRINPKAVLPAMMMLDLGRRMPIWQPARQLERQGHGFSGLDCFLLLDTSMSMLGERARYAAVMSACLMEGLQLAIDEGKADPLQKGVDIRAQILAFGNSVSRLSPLGSTFETRQKVRTFSMVLNALSAETMIGSALGIVRKSACNAPERSVLCLIVSDGRIYDEAKALRLIADMPSNTMVGQINIGEFEGEAMTPHCSIVHDPGSLPAKLKAVLEDMLPS